MSKRQLAFCDGPHDGPCPNRVVRLLSEMREQGVTFSQGCNAAAVFQRIVELGRGLEDLGCEAPEVEECPHGADKPRFDKEPGELWARGECLHCFGPQASNEVAILKKFQRSRWRPKVSNPLGKGKSEKYGASLKTTVRRLNECQDMIEFHSHPKTRAVSWKWKTP